MGQIQVGSNVKQIKRTGWKSSSSTNLWTSLLHLYLIVCVIFLIHFITWTVIIVNGYSYFYNPSSYHSCYYFFFWILNLPKTKRFVFVFLRIVGVRWSGRGSRRLTISSSTFSIVTRGGGGRDGGGEEREKEEETEEVRGEEEKESGGSGRDGGEGGAEGGGGEWGGWLMSMLSFFESLLSLMSLLSLRSPLSLMYKLCRLISICWATLKRFTDWSPH